MRLLRPRLRMDSVFGSHLRVRDWEYAPHQAFEAEEGEHTSVEIAWVDIGNMRYRMGRRDFTLAPEAAILVPAHIEHTTTFLGPVQGGSIKLSQALLGEVADSIGGRARGRDPLQPAILANSQQIVELGRMIRLEAQRQDPGRHLVVDSLVQTLAVHLLRRDIMCWSTDCGSDPRIGAAVEQLHQDFTGLVTIEALARTAGMSRYHFCRQFRRMTGKSPYRYLLDLRLSRAASLLRQGQHNVTSAALTVGFGDLSHFSRMFRTWAGQTPDQYRRERSVTRTPTVHERQADAQHLDQRDRQQRERPR